MLTGRRITTFRRRLLAGSLVAACGALLAAGVVVAHADAPGGMNFVPPKVAGPSVDIGATVIDGQTMDPGLHVKVPDVTVTIPPTPGATAGTGRRGR